VQDALSAPDNTAVRVALWRALHAQVDSPPLILEDDIGLRLVAPAGDWRLRPDMDPVFTRPFRASILARARFIEDLVLEQAARGVGQYVILGAGLDTFVQRRPQMGAKLRVFEIDRPGPQAWKRQRLMEVGLGIADWLRLVPVDFEVSAWRKQLASSGFDPRRPAVVACAGVSLYLTREAIASTLRDAAALAPGSTLAMTFVLPIELADPAIRPGLELAQKGARASGTPFISFFEPDEILTMARAAGFGQVRHISAANLRERYFAGRTDGLYPPDGGEEILVAEV
jgi:methyltransferase (TIGR00027 family)